MTMCRVLQDLMFCPDFTVAPSRKSGPVSTAPSTTTLCPRIISHFVIVHIFAEYWQWPSFKIFSLAHPVDNLQ